MVEYESVYADYVTQFIAFKRGLGYKYTGAEFRFRRFDRFAVKEGCTVVGITKEMFEKWMEPEQNEAESNRYRRVNELINFSKFLNAFGIVSFCPRNIPHKPTSFIPYIFTHEEITRFFTACDDNMAYTRPAAEFTYATPALYRLLYGTGLRIGEALSLESDDVHLEEECRKKSKTDPLPSPSARQSSPGGR